jgi:ketosteroid isomerase-like protein
MTNEIADRFMQTLQQIEASGDVEPLVEMFAEDAESINLAMVEPLRGKDGIRRFWQKYLSVFDRIHSDFTHVTTDSKTAVMEWRSQGTLSHGEDVHYRGVSIIEIDNGLVRGFRTYYDSAVFLPTGTKKVQR